MADKSPEEIVTAAEKEANAKIDKEVWGGPTIFVNRANVQGYSGAGVRLSFAEQFSADLDVLPTFRVAVYMHPSTAAQLDRKSTRLNSSHRH